MLDFLNSNAPAVQSLITVVLVALTGWYVAVTHKIAETGRRSQRPYVQLDVRSQGGPLMEIGLTNYGERAAENIMITVAQDIVDHQGRALSESPPFATGLAYLPAGRSYRWEFIAPDNFWESDTTPTVLDAAIRYSHGVDAYEEPVRFDFGSMQGVLLNSLRDADADAADQLKIIARHLAPKRNMRMYVDARTKKPCPSCTELIGTGATKCPHCLERILEQT